MHQLASSIKHAAAALCNIRETVDNFDTCDLLHFFNECYADAYLKIGRKESGFYAKRAMLKTLQTAENPLRKVESGWSIILPDYVTEVVDVFEAQEEFDSSRRKYQNASALSRQSRGNYVLEGRRLLVSDSRAGMPVWIEYLPPPVTITWPIKNRDPEMLRAEDVPKQPDGKIIGYIEISDGLAFRDIRSSGGPIDMRAFYERDDWEYRSHFVSEPFLIVNFKNKWCDLWQIKIYERPGLDAAPSLGSTWNAFDWLGHATNCECLYAVHNAFTLGDMAVRDHADGGKIKRLGFYPDTVINYPNAAIYDLMVYRMADKLAKLSGIDSILIEDGLIEATRRFEQHTRANRASFRRIEAVQPFSIWR